MNKNYDSFAGLNEAQQTYIIDAIKDKVAADPQSFGLTDVDVLEVGQELDLSSIFNDADNVTEVFSNASELSKEAMDAIVANKTMVS